MATPEEHLVGLAGEVPSDADRSDSQRQSERSKMFVEEFGGRAYGSYEEVLSDEAVGAVYIPLPPALHYPWAKKALKAHKHVLLEKPFTSNVQTTEELLDLAEANNLAVHENYMFTFHSQIDWVREAIANRLIGDVRVIRIDFGFPFRGQNDFRYSRALGGGALLDCGGYTLKLASMLLGSSARVVASHLNDGRNLDVDLFGSATLENDDGLVAQVSFGMDNEYRCNIDIWGSEGTITSGRILTAPAGFEPTMIIRRNGEKEVVSLPADDSFRKSIEHFACCITNENVRANRRVEILHQARLVEAFSREAH